MRVHFHTFGCKANQYDSERMRQASEARGAVAVTDWRDADVCVVNTCTVTNQADAEARRFVRRVHRDNPTARLVVAGCSAALRPGDYEVLGGVTAVVSGADAARVARTVAGEGQGRALVPLELRSALERIDTEPVGAELLRERAGATRGWLKIQDGCDRRCSFCATRLARGPSRSRPARDVIREARLLARTHPELVLTGIHIGHYGRDLEEPITLSRLVARLLDEVPAVRLRLGSVEATEVDDLLVELIATSSGALAPHLHMPLQSGADPVLRRMRRWHTREAYRRRTLKIVGRVPVLGLGADVITGFPAETEADHMDTRTLIEELPFTYLHVFPFSPRDGTPGAELNARTPVPQRVSAERARELRSLVASKAERYRALRAGDWAEVTLEGDGSMGLTGDYLRVRVAGGPVGEKRDRGLGRLHRGVLRAAEADLHIDLAAPCASI